ncbi:TRAP transporter large permease [Salipiger sp.]|uniref:TRAP transporter large permease n=1 Tax=Salipiger sp. TaxID=2078585 RepID=UPI003A973A26
MTDPQVGLLAIAALFVLIAARVPLAVALTGVPFVGIWYLISWKAAIGSLKIIPYNFAANWQLSSVPMFLLMGYLAYHTGITRGLFKAARMWLSRLPGGLAIASILGASGFSAVTGSSVACAAAMGKIAVPEMLRSNYSPSLATGTVAAAGTIGALIPPSILFIIFGIIAQVPVGELFIGGAVAGALTALSYIVVVVLWAKLDPAAAPAVRERFTLREMLASLLEVGPVLLLAGLVFGGLFAGLFTPTEAGAVGAALCALIALFQRLLSWENFRKSVVEAFATSTAIFAIAIGANLLARFVAISGADSYITEALSVVATNTFWLMVMIVCLYLVLGMFLDPLGAMLLTLPILLPVVQEQNLNLLWFGVILGKLLEVGMITPPVGLNVFVLKSVVGDSIPIASIFRGVVYFLMADVVIVGILIAFPQIILYLPSLMN